MAHGPRLEHSFGYISARGSLHGCGWQLSQMVGLPLGKRRRPINAAGMGKECNVMGVTGGVFGDTEVASRCRDTGPGQALKDFVDRLLQLQI